MTSLQRCPLGLGLPTASQRHSPSTHVLCKANAGGQLVEPEASALALLAMDTQPVASTAPMQSQVGQDPCDFKDIQPLEQQHQQSSALPETAHLRGLAHGPGCSLLANLLAAGSDSD